MRPRLRAEGLARCALFNLGTVVKNIYCRNSRLSSLCMRALIERYVAGDTATEAQHYLTGCDCRQRNATPLNDPSQKEAATYINRFLSIYPSSYTQVRCFAEACRQERPDQWRPVKISRQTVNAYFLRLGRYCWDQVARPHLAKTAREHVKVFDELNQELGLIDHELTELLVRNIASRYVKQANGTHFAQRDTRLRYGRTIVYLTERARKYQGLSLHHSREHMAWAFMINSVQNTRGHDDRPYGGRFLTSLLMRRPM